MIILIVNIPGRTLNYTFSKKAIIIGGPTGKGADIQLPISSLHSNHILLSEEAEGWVITNAANDESATLNGLPFDVQKLHQNDCLYLGDAEIVLKGDSLPLRDSFSIPANFDLDAELSKLDAYFGQQESSPLPEVADLANLDIEALFEEVERLDLAIQGQEQKNSKAEENHLFKSKDFTDSEFSQRNNLDTEIDKIKQEETMVTFIKEDNQDEMKNNCTKDYSHYEDDEQERLSCLKRPLEQGKSSLGRIISILMVILVITCAAGVGTYLTLNQNNLESELFTAQAISDITVGVINAQLTRQQPSHNNWSEPVFIQENLQAVLSTKYRARSYVDNQGTITHTGYQLQIAVNPSQQKFLIAALPKSGLLQWLVPKKAIYVNSENYSIYKTNDIQELQTMLRQVKQENNLTSIYYTPLEKNSELITLDCLNRANSFAGFCLPKELQSITPQAADRVYNAPRYYKLSREVIETAAQLQHYGQNDRDVIHLTKLIHKYSSYPDYVFYSSQGKELALQALQGLNKYSSYKGFVGYIDFNVEEGLIAESQLVKEDTITFTDKQENGDLLSSNLEESASGDAYLISHENQSNQVANQSISWTTDENVAQSHIGLEILRNYIGQPPSKQLDESITHALSLLTPATAIDQTLWSAVIRARKMATLWPEQNIQQFLNSPLGFTGNKSYSNIIHSLFKDYIDAYQTKASNQPLDEASERTYSKLQLKRLNQIITYCKSMQVDSQALIEQYDEYITRLQCYLDDYLTAKEMGALNQSIRHDKKLAKIKSKLESFQALQPIIVRSAAQNKQYGMAYERLASHELKRMRANKKITATHVQKLEKRLNQVAVPDFTEDRLADKIAELTKKKSKQVSKKA